MSYRKRDGNLMRIVLSLLGSAVVIGIVGYVIYRADSSAQGVSAFLGVFGSLCSIAGLAFTCYQVIRLKRISSATREAVEAETARIGSLLSASNISASTEMASEIGRLLKSGNYSFAYERLKQCKTALVGFSYDAELLAQAKIMDEDMHRLIRQISRDINNLFSVAYGKGDIDIEILHSHMEEVRETFDKIHGRMVH